MGQGMDYEKTIKTVRCGPELETEFKYWMILETMAIPKIFFISLHMLESLNFLFDIHYTYYITVVTFAFLRHFIHVLKKAYLTLWMSIQK